MDVPGRAGRWGAAGAIRSSGAIGRGIGGGNRSGLSKPPDHGAERKIDLSDIGPTRCRGAIRGPTGGYTRSNHALLDADPAAGRSSGRNRRVDRKSFGR